MTTKEMIEVMQAYERGEQIEYRESPDNYCNLEEWDDEWMDAGEPLWDWTGCEYRIKPKSTYRPYKNAKEFLNAQKDHGMYLREKVSQGVVMPLGVNDYRVILPDNKPLLTSKDFLYENILNNFVWQDGTPCGVKEE